MRSNRAHTGNRRSHHALKNITVSKDAKTGAVHMRHRASAVTGMYRGHQVVDVAKRLVRKEKKTKAESTQAK
jgi:ribosomal protein L32